jgi:hypothetical protein
MAALAPDPQPWLGPFLWALGAVFAAHVAFQLMDRRRFLAANAIQRDGLMRIVQPRHFTSRYRYPALSASPSAGDGCAGPCTPSMRLFQASQASRSACLRASVARSADARIEPPYIVSLDFVPMPKGCAGSPDIGKPLQIAVDGVPGTTEATRHPRQASTALLAAAVEHQEPQHLTTALPVVIPSDRIGG